MENNLNLTDQELAILSDIIKQYKISITVGDLSNFLSNEQSTPLLTILDKLNALWEAKKPLN